MEICKKEVWVLMSKDRKVIVKGIPRYRYLCMINGNDQKRIMTYASRGRAAASARGFYADGLWNEYTDKPHDMDYDEYLQIEPVKVEMTMKIIEE